MNKILCLVLLNLCALYSCIGQRIISAARVSPTSTHVKGNNFEGAIFSDAYRYSFLAGNDTSDFIKERLGEYQKHVVSRFTPSFAQVEAAENILQHNLRRNNRTTYQQSRVHGAIIRQRTRKYQRQYFGFISDRNEEIIFINANWKAYTLLDRINKLRNWYKPDTTWQHEYSFVLDGGSHHWQITVNLTTGQLFDFGYNGVSLSLPHWRGVPYATAAGARLRRE
jgi:hypothetical protein